MTKREMFVAIGEVEAVKANAEMVEFLQHEIDLLDAKRGAKKTPTKTQQANEGVKVAILEVLREADAPMTVTEILATEGMGDYTNQKISALLRQLVLAGKVEKTLEGKKAYFKAVAEEEGI